MSGQTAVITGGTRGIGLDITLAFAEAGYDVFVGARARPAGALPASVRVIETDVRREADVVRLVAAAREATGRLDTLVNNAGYSEWRPIEKIDEAFLSDILGTNLLGAFWGCKAAAAAMRHGGSIVNVSSIAGKRGSANNSAYVASKFAMNGLTQSLCKELGPRGIRVNGICPVLVATPGLLDALRSPDSPTGGGDADAFFTNFAAGNAALKRLPSGKEVAAACVFLASPAASAITGQNLNVDCGVFPQ